MTYPDLVSTAEAVRAGHRPPSAFVRVFRRSTVYCQASPGSAVAVDVREVGGQGRWLPVFTILERLGAFAAECDWLSLTGADLREHLPADVSFIVDPQEKHALVVPTDGGVDE